MTNPTCFSICILLLLSANALAIKTFGPLSDDLFLQGKPGMGNNLAGYDEAGYDSLISMDEEYYPNNHDAAEFSSILDESEDTLARGLKKRCAYNCAGKCYDPLTEQCCNGILLNGFWSCSKCVHRCVDRCYPKTKGYKCCSDKVIPNAWQCCPHHCAGKCFDAATQKCCNNIIIARNRVCCKHYCGDNCYKPSITACCNKEVVDKIAICCKNKCGRVCYNKVTQRCCNNKVIPIGNTCCPSGKKTCGRACFVASTHKCCGNRVTPRHYLACGGTCYNPAGKKCCDNKITPRTHPACGKKCYNPANQKCCGNRVLPGRGACGCTRCGGRCMNTNTHRCCHGRKTIKNVLCISGSGTPKRITTGLIARRVGCFRDHGSRAIPTLEGRSHLLTGNYQKRRFAIKKCALAAAKRGWSVFAVQHQGWCASSPTAGRTYRKYGVYNTCRNGKGGPWGNDVYVLEGNALQKTTRGDICVFPFIYKGKRYNGCTRVDQHRSWCAITPNYDLDRMRGNC